VQVTAESQQLNK